MNTKITRRALASGVATLLAAPAVLRAAEPMRLRVTVASVPTHFRTVSAADFCQKVEAASKGAIKTQLFHSGQLFNDLTVVTALMQSQVEMSMPGTWGIGGFVPSAEMMQLPAMYSRPADVAHAVVDGKAGQAVNAEIEAKLKLRVLGRWLDLGFENWYATKPKLASYDDLKGMKIRNSGGAGKAWRTSFMGAIPNTTPMPSVQLALSQGTFDGLISANETMASSSMWDSHVRSVLEDHQTFNAYIPLISASFWNGLTKDQQSMMTEIWNGNIDTYRGNMAASEIESRKKLLDHNVVFTVPDEKEIAAMRARMLTQQDELVKKWRVTPEIAAIAAAEANRAG